VSSQDIEAQYQQDSTGTMSFRTGRFNYELDFSGAFIHKPAEIRCYLVQILFNQITCFVADMTQTNQSTNTRRPVRRLQQ